MEGLSKDGQGNLMVAFIKVGEGANIVKVAADLRNLKAGVTLVFAESLDSVDKIIRATPRKEARQGQRQGRDLLRKRVSIKMVERGC